MDADGGMLSLGTAIFQDLCAGRHLGGAVVPIAAKTEGESRGLVNTRGCLSSHAGAGHHRPQATDEGRASIAVGISGSAASRLPAELVVGIAKA